MMITKCIAWSWRISQPFHKAIMVNSVVGGIRVCISLAFIGVCKHLVDIATGNADGSIAVFAVLMLLCPVLQLALGAINVKVENHSEVELRNSLRERLFVHTLESQWCGRNARHSGDMTSRLTDDVATVSNTICRNVPFSIITFVRLVGALIFFLMLDARLTIVMGLIMPLALLMSKLYIKRMRRLNSDMRNTDSSVQQCVQESIQNRTLIQTMEYAGRIALRLHSLHGALSDLTMRRTKYSLFSSVVVQSGFICGYAIAFLWGIYGLKSGAITFGMMTAFLQLVSQVQHPTVELSRLFPVMVRAITSVERIEDVLSMPTEKEVPHEALSGSLGLMLSGVHYTYPGNTAPILSGFSYDFRPGTVTAIVGETGVGKSTIFRLILALITPDEGSVVFYDNYRKCMASPSTRCYISYVPQGNSLISGTIRDNLLMGNPSASDNDLQQVLHTAAADFVFDLPDGLDSLCCEQGTGLSEGQALRIAIARGLLRPGGILLLDEPTSSLDKHTGEVLLKRLARQIPYKTIIIITHNERVAQVCHNQIKLTRI